MRPRPMAEALAARRSENDLDHDAVREQLQRTEE
jgi:hypothetical protein